MILLLSKHVLDRTTRSKVAHNNPHWTSNPASTHTSLVKTRTWYCVFQNLYLIFCYKQSTYLILSYKKTKNQVAHYCNSWDKKQLIARTFAWIVDKYNTWIILPGLNELLCLKKQETSRIKRLCERVWCRRKCNKVVDLKVKIIVGEICKVQSV